MRRIHTILAVLLVTILVVAGPCPACPAPAAETSAHDCCPGGKTTKQAPSQNDCPLIAYYLDVSKDGKGTQETLALLAHGLDLAVAAPVLPAQTVPVVSTSPDGSASGRHNYLLNTTLLI